MIGIDASGFGSREETHAALRAALGSENYIGSNLDALHDCLTSVCEPVTIRIFNWSAAARRLGEYADRLWRVLDDSVGENPMLTVIIE